MKVLFMDNFISCLISVLLVTHTSVLATMQLVYVDRVGDSEMKHGNLVVFLKA